MQFLLKSFQNCFADVFLDFQLTFIETPTTICKELAKF